MSSTGIEGIVRAHNLRNESGLISLFVVGLFAATISVPRVLGSGGAVRLKLLIEAAVFVLFLSGLVAVIFARQKIRLHREYGQIFTVFVVFLSLNLVGLVTGIWRSQSFFYVLGDYYQFTIPVAAVLGIYGAAQSSASLERAFAAIFRIYLLLIAGTLSLYLLGVLDPNQRLGLIYQLPVSLVVAYWLYRNGDSVARFGFPALAVATLPILYYSQSLSLLLQVGLTSILAVVFYHAEDPEEFISLGFLLGLAGVIGVVIFLMGAHQIPASQWKEYGYIGNKVAALVGNYTLYERLILLGGSRAAEPIGIVARIDDSIFEVLFGAGMGSKFAVSSPFPDSPWTGVDHFVHSGFWEATLRTGILGAITYLGIVLSYFYVGWQVSSDSYLGAAAAANAAVLIVFLPVRGTFLGTQFFPFALFAYALVRWGEIRSERYAFESP